MWSKTVSLVCLITLFALITQSSAQMIWNGWNTNIQNSGFVYPTLPTFTGCTLERLPNSTWAYRDSQYGYRLTCPSPTPQICLINCGPRSYLTRVGNGPYYCKRDTTAFYYGGVSGATYTDYCLPDLIVAPGSTCHMISPLVLYNLHPGACSTATSFSGYPYQSNDANISPCCFKASPANDLEERGLNSAYTTLRQIDPN